MNDAAYDAYMAAYDIHRNKLTANRIALYVSTLPELAMGYGCGQSSKYIVRQDTIRWMLQTQAGHRWAAAAQCARSVRGCPGG